MIKERQPIITDDSSDDNITGLGLKSVDLPYGLNAEDFWGDMADWDATDQQKAEWLTALAHIVKSFVDWGLGQDTVQMLLAQNFVDSFDNDQVEDDTDSVNMVEQKTIAPHYKAASVVARKAGKND